MPTSVLTTRQLLLHTTLAIAAFLLATVAQPFAPLTLLYLFSLLQLARAPTARQSFYFALLVGIIIFACRLTFFFHIFGIPALALWTLLSLFPAFFVLLFRSAQLSLPPLACLLIAPILWTGIEYFRCELYTLRFSWLSIGLAFGNDSLVQYAGVYGTGFLIAAAASLLQFLPRPLAILAGIIFALILAPALSSGKMAIRNHPIPNLHPIIVGIQLESATEPELLAALNAAADKFPTADLFMLSEYAIASPPTPAFANWCRARQKYLLLGGIQPSPTPANPDAFSNTAYVLGPDGTTLFTQAKSVPIQFFNDGFPATSQKIWHSPWGNIGICICYDLSYSRVTDNLIAQGAQLLLVPAMNPIAWGPAQHELDSHIAIARAAEYGIPIVRTCSSGISQVINASGHLTNSTPFPAQGQLFAENLTLSTNAHLPIDRLPAKICAALTALFALRLALLRLKRPRPKSTPPNSVKNPTNPPVASPTFLP